ncbi:MAG: DUF2339 domain-containing protein [Pedobacter sp.]|nr:MAG: DUF2339 domain-containing protein [Pedobacter sp.]
MDILILIILIVILILMIKQRSSIKSSVDQLEVRVMGLQEMIRDLKLNVEPVKPVVSETKAPVPERTPPIVKESPPVIKESPLIIPSLPRIDEKPTVEKPIEKEVIQSEEMISSTIIPGIPAYKDSSYTPKQPVWEPKPSFFERHPDLEKFIGENLVNKIGIAILVLSIGYFVKYAIDSNWVGEIGRVAIGILCGGVIIGFAHRLRNSYTAFSSVLVGGGLAVFYFTITLAFHQFHLFNQLTAFIILIVITMFAVALSLLYDRQELAIISLVGGFVSPFMLSTGTSNYNGLFLYLVILNVGLLIIAYYKQWRILNITAFGLTVIVFAAVLFKLTAPTYYLGFIYSTIFYLLYLAINIAYNIREGKKFIASDFSILLINTALYFSVGLFLLSEMKHPEFRGLFSAALGILNLGLSYFLFRSKRVDTNVLYLLIGITLTFISLTAPIQLNGNNITIFWASEAVVLYWLYIKSEIKLTRITSLGIWVLMIISLIMDWDNAYSYDNVLPIIANKGFVTSLFSAIATFVLGVLVSKDVKDQAYFKIPKHLFELSAVVILFIGGLLEVNHQVAKVAHLNSIYLMLYVAVFVIILNLISTRLNSVALSWHQKLALFVMPIAMFFFAYPNFSYAQRAILEEHAYPNSYMIGQYLSAIAIGVIFSQLVWVCRKHLAGGLFTTSIWLLCASIVLFLSLEINLLNNAIFSSPGNSINHLQQVYVKTGLPVIWGLLSFSMMWLGMKHKNRTLRIVSLSLFTLTLIKLFLFDIKNIPAAGKIVAFFSLGLLLLIVSFMYQKVKKIIVADEEIKVTDDEIDKD